MSALLREDIPTAAFAARGVRATPVRICTYAWCRCPNDGIVGEEYRCRAIESSTTPRLGPRCPPVAATFSTGMTESPPPAAAPQTEKRRTSGAGSARGVDRCVHRPGSLGPKPWDGSIQPPRCPRPATNVATMTCRPIRALQQRPQYRTRRVGSNPPHQECRYARLENSRSVMVTRSPAPCSALAVHLVDHRK